MKLFGFNITRDRQELKAERPKTPVAQEFNTPFLKIGEGNLSMPYVSPYYSQDGTVRFGTDNLYPQVLNQLYFQSPIHSACINFIVNAICGGGYEWNDDSLTAEQKVDLIAFEKANHWKKLVKLVTRDWTIHRRICIKVIKRGKITLLERLDPSTIRSSTNQKYFIYSYDWSRGMVNSMNLNRWHYNCDDEVSLFYYQEDLPGQDIYAIPSYNSILNWAFLDGEQSWFHKNWIQNSIFPSLAIRRPKEFQSIDEIQKFKEEIRLKSGAGNSGSVMVLTGNGMDDVPEIHKVEVNGANGVFTDTAKEIKEQICIAHNINPAIMGIKTAGQLGATTEIQDSYRIFEKNKVLPERDEVQHILNELIHITGIKNSITLNNFQIIQEAIVNQVPKA